MTPLLTVKSPASVKFPVIMTPSSVIGVVMIKLPSMYPFSMVVLVVVFEMMRFPTTNHTGLPFSSTIHVAFSVGFGPVQVRPES